MSRAGGPERKDRGDWSWTHDGACAEHPHPEWWFPELGSAARDSARARAVCIECPVRSECLLAGLKDDHGIWAGTMPPDRRALRRRMRQFPDADWSPPAMLRWCDDYRWRAEHNRLFPR